MKIDKVIHDAIKKAIAERGSQAELARKAGISDSYITRYASGAVKNITLENWNKLAPHLSDYLPENYLAIEGDNSGNIQQHSGVGSQMAGDAKRDLINKILDSEELDAETKVRVMRILNDD